MNLTRLILRSLAFHWRTSIPAALGVAVAVAVIVGSLVVGDSVTGSLKDSALSGLGGIDYAVTSSAPLHAELPDELASSPQLKSASAAFAPVLLTIGSVRNADTDVVVPNVSVLGVDDRFLQMFPDSERVELSTGSAAVSEALASDLRVKPGGGVILTVPKAGAIPSDTLFAGKSLSDTASSTRLDVSSVLPQKGPAGFRLTGASEPSRSIIVNLSELSERIGAAGKANTILSKVGLAVDKALPLLESSLKSALKLEDHGLTVSASNRPDTLTVRSSSITLSDPHTRAIRDAAYNCALRTELSSVYLATRIANVKRPTKSIPYSMVAGIQGFPTQDVSVAADGMWLNAWAAQDLGAVAGDQYSLEYLEPQSDGAYRTRTIRLRLQGILPMTGLAVDSALSPLVHGITDAKRVDDWNTPFPVDLSKITPRDEAYWDKYRAAPKVFVRLGTARTMWTSSMPDLEKRWVTSVLVGPRLGGSLVLPDRAELEKALLANLSPADSGISIRPLREQALAASQGSTDFRSLFVSMSFFIFLAGLGLAAGLMRLMADSRASEAGIMLASGLRISLVSRVIAGEGAIVSLVGSVLGVPLGLAYAYLLVRLVGGAWSGAIASTPVGLHINWATVLAGAIAGFLAGCVSSWIASRTYRGKPVVSLLRGGKWTPDTAKQTDLRKKAWLPIILAVAAFAMVIPAGRGDAQSLSWVFYVAGTMLLVAGSLGARHILFRLASLRKSGISVALLAGRYAASNRARSLLISGLLSCAVFIIVTAAANVSNLQKMEFRRLDSGAGGFALRIVTTLPLGYDIGTAKGREKLGFQAGDVELLGKCKFVGCLMSPGDDVSCLNMNRPVAPRLLGVGQDMLDRGGFGVITEGSGTEKPWQLLSDTKGKSIPAFGDANSVMWILHSGLGREYEVKQGNGQTARARFAGLLPSSVFAGEILIPRESFLKLYPGMSQPKYFLVEAPEGRESEVAAILRQGLGDYGAEVRSTAEILSSYARVQDTYLSMFIALGGFGLLLGTLGLVIVILRSAMERRSEFALMAANGIGKGKLASILLLENALLIAIGAVVGCVSAMVAVSPRLKSVESGANWPAVIGVLAAIVLTGLISSWIAASAVTKGDLIAALREE